MTGSIVRYHQEKTKSVRQRYHLHRTWIHRLDESWLGYPLAGCSPARDPEIGMASYLTFWYDPLQHTLSQADGSTTTLEHYCPFSSVIWAACGWHIDGMPDIGLTSFWKI